ncbi:unnamed protein product [Cyclocybe aegerita]|uniref:Glucanase n=1 Tax=Cyclocybe aegerita TaxID=1973307 RepID=A0A8S0W5F2_CYCAE|nr:unnamed protein product [Cyclocybe aegerita]
MAAHDSITTQFCNKAKVVFGDHDSFGQHGGMAGMSRAMAVGMVLVLSIWDNHTANMLWLDSNYPTNANLNKPGIARGTCLTTSGVPAEVEELAASVTVTHSNIKFGDIGTTYSGTV